MRLIPTIFSLLLTSTVTTSLPLAHSLTTRDVINVLDDLTKISTSVSTLDSSAIAFAGSVAQVVALASTVSDLENAITTAVFDINSSSAFSSDDSASVLDAVNNLTPKLLALLSDLNAKVNKYLLSFSSLPPSKRSNSNLLQIEKYKSIELTNLQRLRQSP